MSNQNLKWMKWLGLMDTNYLKHDITLYRLIFYEKTLVNPRISLEQEGMSNG